MSRSEFPTKVRVAAFERSGGRCEKCTAKLGPGNVEYDHVLADWLGGLPTLDNCEVLCRSCHRGPGGKTSDDIRIIARVKRVGAKHIGAKAKSRHRLPGGRDSGWKHVIGQGWVRREQ